MATQLVYSDDPGDLPAEYVLPPNLDLLLQSVVARFDGSGAASSFVPTLSAYSQDGRLMARVRADQTFSPGDTGVVTWAPFLRRRTTAISVRAIGALVTRPLTDPVSIPSSTTPTVLHWDDVEFDTSGFFDAGADTRFTVPTQGVYVVAGSGSFVTDAIGDRYVAVRRSSTGATWVTAGKAGGTFFWAGNVVGVAEFDAGEYVELYVAQDRGSPLNTGDMFFCIYSIGTF